MKMTKNRVSKYNDRSNTYFRRDKRILQNTFQKTGTKNCDRNGIFFSHVDIQNFSKNQAKL